MDQGTSPPTAPPADSLGEAIRQHRRRLESQLSAGLEPIASACAGRWHDRQALDAWLQQQFAGICCCQLLYVIDTQGRQCSSNISRAGIDPQACGQNLSGRPYLAGYSQARDFILSDVYISRFDRRSCLTALRGVRNQVGELLGYLAADFDLRDLPQLHKAAETPVRWRQIKGDPAIRQTLFQQERIGSAMDACLNRVHDIVHELITERGVFHTKLHYGSSRATLWLNADPRRYRIHVLDEIMDPAVCLAYPRDDYPEDALVSQAEVRTTLERFVNLRLGDSVIYLRTASVNVINGLVALNFSCDGTHYLPVSEFLQKDHRFWFGA
jgi:hypothetical protein